MDGASRAVEVPARASKSTARVAAPPSVLRRIGHDGQLPVSLAGRSRPGWPSDRQDRRCHQPRVGPFGSARFDGRKSAHFAGGGCSAGADLSCIRFFFPQTRSALTLTLILFLYFFLAPSHHYFGASSFLSAILSPIHGRGSPIHAARS